MSNIYSVIWQSYNTGWRETFLRGSYEEMEAEAEKLRKMGYDANIRGVINSCVQFTDEENNHRYSQLVTGVKG